MTLITTTAHEKALACLAGQNEGESTEYRTKEPINLNHQTTSAASTTARVTITPKAQAWLDAHPGWEEEPVVNLIRAGFSDQELRAIFDRLKAAPCPTFEQRPVATGGASLRTLRELAGLTVGELASRTGYGVDYLTRVEAGEFPASPPLLLDLSVVIADYLKMSAVA